MRKLKGRKGEKGKLRTMARIDEDLIKKVDLLTRSRNDHQFHRDREPSLWGKLPALHRMAEEHRGGITMTLDTDRLRRKIAYIRQQVNTINGIVKTYRRQKIIEDTLILSAIKYFLQTSIEAMIDIVYHVAAKKFNYPPSDARDALKMLSKKKVISASEFDTYSAMVGLCNRLVHGYEDVSPELLYEIITEQLGDFVKFIASIIPLIIQLEENRPLESDI